MSPIECIQSSGLRIAIIGSGISGMTVGHLLARDHNVTLFEAGDYIGGHTATIAVEHGGETVHVDTGFIVFNKWTYPNFCQLLTKLGVESQPSSMSISVSNERSGIEYKSESLDTLFAQRANFLRPGFYRMIADIWRFSRDVQPMLQGEPNTQLLGEFIADKKYGSFFVENFLIPMGAAIWSASEANVLKFPVRQFAHFFHNHGMLYLNGERPQWRVIKGGSKNYIAPLVAPFRQNIHLNTPIEQVRRFATHVEVIPTGGKPQCFDHVIFATHSDQALRILGDHATLEELEILGSIPYQPNRVLLHTDSTMLPQRRKAWASWNYVVPQHGPERVPVTYNMNILQSLPQQEQFLVTLNREGEIDAQQVIREFTYDHPIYSKEAFEAQARHAEISGQNRTSYCGAYWGWGFHEDGVNSALAVCREFGASLSQEAAA